MHSALTSGVRTMESNTSNVETVTTGDRVYQGMNFSLLRRELTFEKLWRERTWKEILKHFVTALIFGTLGSFIDIGTDGQKEELKL